MSDFDAEFIRIKKRLDALEAKSTISVGLPQTFDPGGQLAGLLRQVSDEIAALRAEVAPMLDAYKKHIEYQAQHGLDPWQSGRAANQEPFGAPVTSDASGVTKNAQAPSPGSPEGISKGT